MPLHCLALAQRGPDLEMLCRLFSELGVEVSCFDDQEEGEEALRTVKFDGLCVDCDWIGSETIQRLRQGSLNRTIIIVGVAAEPTAAIEASRVGANIVLRRPMSVDMVRRSLHVAQSLMLSERRRFFRFPVSELVELRPDARTTVVGNITNISEGGMALACSHPLKVGSSVELEFSVPGVKKQISARGVVAWCKTGERAGVRFEFIPLRHRKVFDKWLDERRQEWKLEDSE